MKLLFLLVVVANVAIFCASQTFAQSDELFCWDQATCCDGHPAAHSLGDWNDCTIYYLCFGTPTLYTCPEGNYYNPENTRCVLQAQVDGCVDGTRAPVDPTAPTTTGTDPPPTESPSTPSPVDGNCTDDGVYYVAYPGDCSKYMICANHILLPEPGQCAPGTLFDPTIGECNLESLVDCVPTCPNDDGVAYLPHDKNCNQYWLCALGVPSLKTCPAGLFFDPKLESCNQEDQVFCPNLCPVDVPTVNFPHSNDCSKYWLCVYGDPTLKQCPEGLFFDPELKLCNPEMECEVK